MLACGTFFSFAMLSTLTESTLTPPTRPSPVFSNADKIPLVNTPSMSQLGGQNDRSEPAPAVNDYPIDPYQLRVPGTTTSVIFSKYGGPINSETFLNLTARAQYDIVRAVVAAHGDGPVSQPDFEWSEKKLYIKIGRPLAREDLTWLMLADTLQGTMWFFGGLQGWFETKITILDDTAGPVGSGSVTFW